MGRTLALHALRRSAGGVPALIKALHDKDALVRREAIKELGHLGKEAQVAIPTLLERAKTAPDAHERVIAAEAAAYVEPRSPAAISALVEMLGERDFGLRGQAAAALGRLGPNARAAVPALSALAVSTDPALRIEAALALAEVAPDNPDVFPVLREVFEDRDSLYRLRALEGLSKLGSADESAASILMRMLWDDAQGRAKAAEVLGGMGPAAKSAVPALTDVLNGSDNQARVQAALALWKIDGRAQEAVAVLVAALRSPLTPSPSKLAPPGRFGVPGLPPAPICQQAAEALAQMGPAAQAAVPAVREVLSDPRLSAYRPYYALALLKMAPQTAKAAVPALIEALERKAPAPGLSEQAASTLRKQAAKALGEIGAPAHDAMPALRKALSDPDKTVGSEASHALKKIGG
jgi:HEAT repeat protein